MSAILEFNSVSLQFKQKVIIGDLSFSLNDSEVIAFLGPSGCGKTTILNVASGLIKSTKGAVNVTTKDFSYIFQEPRLIPWKTVIENILFVAHPLDSEISMKKAVYYLNRVGLEEVLHSYPSELSGGMKQRVSIARAFILNPKIILMDEPFSALNIELKEELQSIVVNLLEETDVGIIYVTHDLQEAIKLADKIYILSPNSCFIQQKETITVNRKERNYYFVKETESAIRQKNGGNKHV